MVVVAGTDAEVPSLGESSARGVRSEAAGRAWVVLTSLSHNDFI